MEEKELPKSKRKSCMTTQLFPSKTNATFVLLKGGLSD